MANFPPLFDCRLTISRHEEAVVAANTLFSTASNDFDGQDYVSKLTLAFEEEKQLASSTGWADIFRQPDLRRTLIAVGVQSLQQAQGSGYMVTFIFSFLTGIGVKNAFPYIMALNSVYFVGVSTGWYIPDKFGRRDLLIGSSAFCGACLIIVAIFTTAFPTPTDVVSKASVALIFLWYFAFGVQGPLIWIVTTESAPTRNREKVLGLATFFGFGVALMINFVAPFIQDAGYGGLGSKIGFLWGAFSVCMVAFAWFFVPEYKGHSLEQLDYLFEQRTATRKFKGYHFADEVLASDGVAQNVLEGDDKAEA